jgi:hypothetical protein
VRLRIELDGLQRDVVHVVGGHVTARAEEIQQRSGAGDLVLLRTQIKGGRALAFVSKRIVHGLGRAVGRLGRVAFAVSGGRPGQRQKCRSPHRISPCVGHHGTVPFVENLFVAGLALPGAVFLLPVVMEGRRKRLSFGHDIRRRFRQTVGDIVQLALVRLEVDQGAGSKGSGHECRELGDSGVTVDHCAAPHCFVFTG